MPLSRTAVCSATGGGPGYWDALVSGGEPKVIKTGDSPGRCPTVVLQHFLDA